MLWLKTFGTPWRKVRWSVPEPFYIRSFAQPEYTPPKNNFSFLLRAISETRE